MNKQELNDFWDAKPVKVWVVNLASARKSKNKQSDRLIVRARTEQGALLCGKRNSRLFSNQKCQGTARYAHPVSDLHCVEQKG